MPNITINILKITNIGKKDWFESGKEGSVEYSLFNFNHIIPEPKSSEECDPKYNLNINPDSSIKEDEKPWFNWYQWRIDNWGTKWNGYDCQILNDDAIKFETAWSPAVEVIKKLSRTHYKDQQLILFTNDEDSDYWYADIYLNGDIIETYRLSNTIPRYESNDYSYLDILKELECELQSIRKGIPMTIKQDFLDALMNWYNHTPEVTKEILNTWLKSYGEECSNHISCDVSENLTFKDCVFMDLILTNETRFVFMYSHFNMCSFVNSRFYEVDFKHSVFTNVEFRSSSFVNSTFYYACFNDCTFIDNIWDHSDFERAENPPICPMACPTEGGFIGWKKARLTDGAFRLDQQCLIKLYIPKDAKRSSATGKKCRTNKAKVLDITDLQGTYHFEAAWSLYSPIFLYEKGKYVEVTDFDENRYNECSSGIHFFVDKEEAINYL